MKGWKGHRTAEKKCIAAEKHIHIAMHEAAHAVAYLTLLGTLNRVSIRPSVLINEVEATLSAKAVKS